MACEHPEFFIGMQTGVSTVLLGEPGTTKSRSVEAFSRYVKRDIEVVIPSQREPADICGYPHLTEFSYKNGDGSEHKEPTCDFVPALWRRRLEHSINRGFKGGIAFFDELKDATPAHQAGIQQVMNDGILNTWICGASNDTEVSSNGYEWSAPIVNRLCVLTWNTPLNEWKTNMLTGFSEQRYQYPVLPDDWENFLPEGRSIIVGFLDAKPDLAQVLPKERSRQGEPWPSLRSWTNAASMIAACKALEASNELRDKLIAGCIGLATTIQFSKYEKHLELPPATMVLSNPNIVNWSDRPDKIFAILSGVVAHVLSKKTKELWLAAWEVILCASESNLSAAAKSAGMLVQGKANSEWKTPERAAKVFASLFSEIIIQSQFNAGKGKYR